MKLDLGFRGDVSINSSLIKQIDSKKFIQTKEMYKFTGKKNSTSLYRIPKIKIGAMSFIEPVLQESSDESRKETVFVKEGIKPSPQDPGRLGWELFYNVNLLIDIKNSKIAFCDSLETLKTQGYLTEGFITTPLFLERGFIEIETQSKEGVLRCILDTGSTWNILNREIAEGKPLEQAIWEPENIFEMDSLEINNKDFGPLSFHKIPVRLPIAVEAILGMDFFEAHLIFLDFKKKQAYFVL